LVLPYLYREWARQKSGPDKRLAKFKEECEVEQEKLKADG
jgi:hypothetical protein